MEISFEKAVLCAVIEDADCFQYFVPVLDEEDFADERNRRVVRGLKEVMARDGRRSTLSLVATIPDETEYIQELQDYLPQVGVRGTADMEEWFAKLKDAAKTRRLKRKVEKVIARDGESSQLVSDLLGIGIEGMGWDEGGFEPLTKAVPEARRIVESWRVGQPLNVEPTGFRDLDEALGGGLPVGNLTIIGARTSTFKTVLATQIAMNVIKACKEKGGVVAYAALEMSADEMILRMACSLAKVDSKVASRGKEVVEKYGALADALDSLEKEYLPWFHSYEGLATSDFLRFQTMRSMLRADVRMLFVDFAELVQDSDGDERRRLVGIYRACRDLAKVLKIPVVCMSQLNRAVEYDMHGTMVPSARNLMQGGEDVAAVVLLLYYPYGYEQIGQRIQVQSMFKYQHLSEVDSPDEVARKKEANRGRLYAIIAKGRFASRKPVPLNVVPEWTYIGDYDPASEEEGVVRLLVKRSQSSSGDTNVRERAEKALSKLKGKDRAAGERDF